MSIRFLKILFAASVAVVAGSVFAGPSNAVPYDLKATWSDTNNPNGPFTYYAADHILPPVASWSGLGPGFADSPTSGTGFTPSIFRATVSAEDFVAGDIVAHANTADSNQSSFGAFNIRFVAPVAGTATISGLLWDAHSSVDRDQDWTLSLNGNPVDFGQIVGDGSNGSGNPDTFNLLLALAVGDVLRLDIVRADGQNGGLVGLNMNVDIDPSAVPIPAALPLFATGLAAMGWLSRRRRKTAVA